MRTFFIVLFILVVSSLGSSNSQAFDFHELHRGKKLSISLKGSYKNLLLTTQRLDSGDVVTEDLNRFRTEWDLKALQFFSAKVIWDHEIAVGDFISSPQFSQTQSQRHQPYLDLDETIVQKKNFYYGQQFYRAYAKIDPKIFNLTLGRQKIDWGIMRLLSPTDLFSPISLFNVEKEERVGATAANLVVPVGNSLRFNVIYDANPDFDRIRMGGRVTKTLGRFDLSVLGGKFLKDTVAGFDLSGDVHKAGIRGEFLFDKTQFGKNGIQLAGGIDYGFENSFYVAAEYFYNGLGLRGTGLQIRTAHHHFAGLQLKYDITPLWKVMMQSIIDLDLNLREGSFFLNPETRYSILDSLEIAAGTHVPVGKTNGEFTKLPVVYYSQLQFFF